MVEQTIEEIIEDEQRQTANLEEEIQSNSEETLPSIEEQEDLFNSPFIEENETFYAKDSSLGRLIQYFKDDHGYHQPRKYN